MNVKKMLLEFEDCINESCLDYNFSELSKDEQIEFMNEAVKILKVYFEN
jgi:hypothetical protein